MISDCLTKMAGQRDILRYLMQTASLVLTEQEMAPGAKSSVKTRTTWVPRARDKKKSKPKMRQLRSTEDEGQLKSAEDGG